MRITAAVIVLVLLSAVLAPPVLVHPGNSGEEAVTIGLLDVCHKSISGVNPDLPFLSICPCSIDPAVAAEAAAPREPVFTLLLPVRPIEEPPVLLS